jgi:hypothetical protein
MKVKQLKKYAGAKTSYHVNDRNLHRISKHLREKNLGSRSRYEFWFEGMLKSLPEVKEICPQFPVHSKDSFYFIDYLVNGFFAFEIDGEEHIPANDFERDTFIFNTTKIKTFRFKNDEVMSLMLYVKEKVLKSFLISDTEYVKRLMQRAEYYKKDIKIFI